MKFITGKRALAFVMSSLFAINMISFNVLAASEAGKPAYIGLGAVGNFREGPGADSTGTPVYSFNYTYVLALFDKDGKVVDVESDILEVSTPNYDGASMPHFSGWPTIQTYNTFDHATEKIIEGSKEITLESATAEIENSWKTKRERGTAYGMKEGNDWFQQMDFFEEWFRGQTVAEIQDWFAKNTTSAGRPIKDTTTNDADIAKLAKLSEAEKQALADVVAGATMSLEDPHGLTLTALKKAFDTKVPIKNGSDIVSLGLGVDKNFRNGPGKDEAGNAVYSFNLVTYGAAFDASGVIVANLCDILEVSTPNYDGPSMPHFIGWPGTVLYPQETPEVAEVEAAVAAPVVVGKAVTYKVANGDVLWKIAAAHGTTIEAIMELNPQIVNKNLIHTGDALTITAAVLSAPTVAPVAAPAAEFAPAMVDLTEAKTFVNTWATKRDRGDTYGMSVNNDWHKQMDLFQEWINGQTTTELKAWFEKNTTSAGRPIKADTTNEADKAKLAALTDAERAALADVVTGASMSLEDPHGKSLTALTQAYKLAKPIKQ